MSLHDELGRLADTAPRPSIDHSVWDRGRALRRRDRLVTSAVVLALVVIVGGLASLVLGPPRSVGPADTTVPDGAIPSRIDDIPDDVTGPLEKDLAIGRASVAFIASNGTPVVIGATDGQYHLLDLPGWSRQADGLALSPDGQQLVWQPHDGSGADSTVLALLDLATGDVAEIRVNQRADIDLRTMTWSPDSRLVGVIGDNPTPPRTIVARVDTTTRSGETVMTDNGETLMSLAVATGGELGIGLGDGGMTVVMRDGTRQSFSPDSLGGGAPGAFSRNDEWLALATPPGTSSLSLHLVERAGIEEHPFPEGTIGKAAVLPLGWLDDRLQFLLVQSVDGSDPELVVTTPTVNVTSTWRRSVGSVGSDVLPAITVAVDLIPDLDGTSSQQLTHDFGEPEWPGQRDISWIIGLGVAAAGAVLLGLRWLWRRRTGLV